MYAKIYQPIGKMYENFRLRLALVVNRYLTVSISNYFLSIFSMLTSQDGPFCKIYNFCIKIPSERTFDICRRQSFLHSCEGSERGTFLSFFARRKLSKMSKGIDKEATIRTHYAELNKFGQNGEYEKAIKAANKSTSFEFFRKMNL